MALIGLGAMGRRHARVLGSLKNRFEVVGGFDVRGDACSPCGIPALRSEADAIARADVVLVATPIEAHAETVGRALDAGRHVFVEKPLCASSAEARTLTGSGRGARLFVGHSERFNPVVRTLARLIREEPVVAIDLRRVGPCRPSRWGVLVNLGVHDFDLAAYLGRGELLLRDAVLSGSGVEGSEDLAHVLFSTSGDAVGHLYVDRTAPAKQRTIELVTARWSYRGDLLSHRLVRVPRSGGAAADVPLPLDEPLVAQALALADAVDGGPIREIATGTDGARAVDLAERAAAVDPRKVALGLRR
ncbi:MAG TPA: Gfo/Idh/MocA family oxidoreductase [Polyangiaceae bacterium]|nr:Gfo/Idh/MocA family oxidoreductase [Polyangiaceae bacterium]